MPDRVQVREGDGAQGQLHEVTVPARTDEHRAPRESDSMDATNAEQGRRSVMIFSWVRGVMEWLVRPEPSVHQDDGLVKKLTSARRAYSIRVTRKRTQRRLRARRRRGAGHRIRVYAPQVFGVQTAYARAKLMGFLKRLRALTSAGAKVLIDFSDTTQMQVAGTLLLATEIDRTTRIHDGKRRIRCTYPRDPVVAQVLEHVGLFGLLGQTTKPTVDHDTVRYWKIDSGTEVEGERTRQAMAGYSNAFSSLKRRALYKGLVEAITNCVQHAYIHEPRSELRRWWMFSQLKDETVTVGLCDRGVGIPGSLREAQHWMFGLLTEACQELGLSVQNDGSLIRAAMKVGKSRTGEEHRGKGLRDIQAAVDGLGGSLQIHSGKGLFILAPASGPETCLNFSADTEIDGTVIVWTLPVSTPESIAVPRVEEDALLESALMSRIASTLRPTTSRIPRVGCGQMVRTLDSAFSRSTCCPPSSGAPRWSNSITNSGTARRSWKRRLAAWCGTDTSPLLSYAAGS